ncbi:MAG: TVP38/TMEM64 family protein [Vicinamibacterales bacterium]
MKGSTKAWLIGGLLLALGVLAALVGREAAAFIPRFGAWVQSLGPWGPFAFIAGYGLAAVLLMPAVLLTLAAGAIFGLTLGVVYVMVGATLGAALAFLSGRYAARRFVEHLLHRYPRLAAIDRAVEREGLRLVFLLRLSPAVPYTLLNYALGLSRVRFTDYLAGSIGMLPTVTMYVYSGKVAGDLATLASGGSAPRGTAYYVALGAGLAATIAVTVYITRIARRAINEAVDKDQ